MKFHNILFSREREIERIACVLRVRTYTHLTKHLLLENRFQPTPRRESTYKSMVRNQQFAVYFRTTITNENRSLRVILRVNKELVLS